MAKRILYALLGIALLSLPWLGGSALTLFVGFVPLLWIQQDVAAKTGRRGKPLVFWPYAVGTFTLWWLATVWWVGYSVIIGVVAATFFGTVLMSAAFLSYHAVWKRAPKALAYTVLVTGWIAYEYVFQKNDEISFPWLVLGNGFSLDVKLVQWYEYTGTLGGSLWVLVVNLLVFHALRAPRRLKSWIAPAAAFALPAVVSLVMYYTYEEPYKGDVKVTIIQPDIDPWREKFLLSQQKQTQIMLDLMQEAPQDVQFIIAPETAIDENIWESEVERAPSIRRFREFIRRHKPGAMFVAGSNIYRPYDSEQTASPTARCHDSLWYDIYNVSLGIDTTGRTRIHRKAKLVIGAEMTPFYPYLKKLKFLSVDLGGISGQLGMDSVRRVFTSVGGIVAGPAICYEAIYGEYFTEFVRNGAQVMFVISNDGWWDDTPGYRYLFSYSRLRAIENRRSIARSANTGKSGFIDQRGDELETLGWDERGTLTDTLRLNDAQTLYTRYGDYIGRLSAYVFILSLLYFMAYRVKRRSHLVD